MKNIIHEHNPYAEICLDASSTFQRLQTDAPRHHHGAGATQRGNFSMVFGVSGNLTAGAPEAPDRRSRVLRTMCG